MLINLKTKNFRKHRSLEVDFTQGMNVCRASNEGGKSTMTEACSYALFGTKALRTSLDDCVTWGENVNSLKVELTVNLGGQVQTFKRGKSGAEVIIDGNVFVSGQTEVTNYAAAQLGVDGATAHKLMMASQTSLRGALEEGPKALSLMIEGLGGFETFDDILEAAEEKLVLGSPATVEERIRQAQATLETTVKPETPDQATLDAKLATIDMAVAALKVQETTLKLDVFDVEHAHTVLSSSYLQGSNLQTERSQISARLDQAHADVAGHTANATKAKIDVSSIKRCIEGAEKFEARRYAYDLFKTMPVVANYYDDDVDAEAAVAAELKKYRDLMNKAQAEVNALTVAVAQEHGKRINHDKCDKCGQDVTHLEHVKATNKAVDEALAKLDADLAIATRSLDSAKGMVDVLTKIQEQGQTVSRLVYNMGEFVSVVKTTYPFTVTWIGEPVGEIGPDLAAYKRQLAEAEVENAAIDSAKSKLDLVTKQRDDLILELEKKCVELDNGNFPSPSELLLSESKLNDVKASLLVVQGDIIGKGYERGTLISQFDNDMRVCMAQQRSVDAAQATLDRAKAEMETLGFNNALIKKLRAIRPLVADQLWNTVLASVSVMFSQIRGEQSTVSKDKDGFRVNGQTIESLSGSTLDILGLALRVTLTKTFLPNCNLLVLDEPGAACDQERVQAMLGFISSCGFDQVLLITHEDISSDVADNIIQL